MIRHLSAADRSPAQTQVSRSRRATSSRALDPAASISHSPTSTGTCAESSKLSTTSSRRRHIDPTTCERDYSADEVEFMQALDYYKRTQGRMFPTCSEILEVLRGLGYSKTRQE
jgi:hypothetical protein